MKTPNRWSALWPAVPFGLGVLLTWGAANALGQEPCSREEGPATGEIQCEVHGGQCDSHPGQGDSHPGQGDSHPEQGDSHPERARRGERVLSQVITDGFDAKRWSERLSDPDIDAREIAYCELLSLAGRNRAACLALESWAVDPTAFELAWTARLALRELKREASLHRDNPRWVLVRGIVESEAARELGAYRVGAASAPDRAAETGSLRNIDIDIVAEAPFDTPGVRSLYVPRTFAFPQRPRASRIQTLREFRLEVLLEGVALRVVDLTGESARSFEYGAETLDVLLAKHPELRHQVPGLVHLALEPPAPGTRLTWGTGKATIFRSESGTLPPGVNPPSQSGDPWQLSLQGRKIEIPTDILGVKCTPVSSEEEVDNCLGPGVGLRIEYREHGTIASELGLERGDILVELCGEQLCDVDEIGRIMSERPGDEVVVKIVDRTGRERTLIWAPRATAVIHLSVGGAKDD